MKSKMCNGDEFDTFDYMLKLCPKWNNKKLSRDVEAARAVPWYETMRSNGRLPRSTVWDSLRSQNDWLVGTCHGLG